VTEKFLALQEHEGIFRVKCSVGMPSFVPEETDKAFPLEGVSMLLLAT